MICMKYNHNKKFGLLKFHSGYGKFYLNGPNGYIQKIINVQTVLDKVALHPPPHTHTCVRSRTIV